MENNKTVEIKGFLNGIEVTALVNTQTQAFWVIGQWSRDGVVDISMPFTDIDLLPKGINIL